MKIKLLTNDLKTALANLEKGLLKDGAVFLATDGAKCTLTIAGMVSATTAINYYGTDGENFSIAVDGKKLATFANRFIADEVTLVAEKNSLKIKCGSVSVKLSGADLTFPEAITIPNTAPLTIPTADFARGIGVVSCCVGKDDPREALRGVNIVARNNQLKFTGCDSFKVARIAIACNHSEAVNYTVPITALQTFMGTPAFKSSESISFMPKGFNKLAVVVGDTVYMLPLISAPYPDIDRLMPKNYTTQFTVTDVGELVGMLETVQITALESTTRTVPLVLSFGDNTMSIGAQSVTSESNAECEIKEVDNISPDFKISFSGAYLIQLFKAIDTDSAVVQLGDTALKPMLITAENIEAMVLPVRTKD